MIGATSDLLLGGGESLLHFLPVHDLPHFLQEGRAHVLVVQVVGVLPHVDRQQRLVVRAQVRRRVLVLRLPVLQVSGALIVQEPAPAGALHSSSLLLEIGLEVLNRAPLALDHESKLAGLVGDDTATLLLRCKGFPEELVVQVAAAVELDSIGKVNVGLDVTGGERLGRLLVQGVQVIDVGAVMLAVVELHEVAGDDGLERAELVRQVFQLHDDGLSGGTGEGLRG
jgi:hypothetical protein